MLRPGEWPAELNMAIKSIVGDVRGNLTFERVEVDRNNAGEVLGVIYKATVELRVFND